jgi:uncharacterized membrane protein
MVESRQRFWEIDFLRGIAIIMMIVFHFLFDLSYFSIYSVDVYSGFWWLFARVTAMIFIFLVGISLTLSYSRIRDGVSRVDIARKYMFRGAKIFVYGLLITLATWLFLQSGFIVFGVLHFIGIAIIISWPLLNRRRLLLVLGVVFILVGVYLQSFTVGFPWLLWLGLRPELFYTLDYFPLLPWMGVILIGMFFGKMFYPDGKQAIKNRSGPVISQLSFLGRHSLVIYLLHQPVLIALLYLLGIGL